MSLGCSAPAASVCGPCRSKESRCALSFGFPPGFGGPLADKLSDLGALRLSEMDEAGITVQVLSASGPGPYLVPGADGVALARDMNDVPAEAVSAHPDRFAGFAELPMKSPDAAADD